MHIHTVTVPTPGLGCCVMMNGSPCNRSRRITATNIQRYYSQPLPSLCFASQPGQSRSTRASNNRQIAFLHIRIILLCLLRNTWAQHLSDFSDMCAVECAHAMDSPCIFQPQLPPLIQCVKDKIKNENKAVSTSSGEYIEPAKQSLFN